MPRRLRQCVEEEVLNYADALTKSPRGEISDLLASTRRLDASLANELEVVIHLYAADSAIAGFMLGWDYRQDPNSVVFAGAADRRWPTNNHDPASN